MVARVSLGLLLHTASAARWTVRLWAMHRHRHQCVSTLPLFSNSWSPIYLYSCLFPFLPRRSMNYMHRFFCTNRSHDFPKTNPCSTLLIPIIYDRIARTTLFIRRSWYALRPPWDHGTFWQSRPVQRGQTMKETRRSEQEAYAISIQLGALQAKTRPIPPAAGH